MTDYTATAIIRKRVSLTTDDIESVVDMAGYSIGLWGVHFAEVDDEAETYALAWTLEDGTHGSKTLRFKEIFGAWLRCAEHTEDLGMHDSYGVTFRRFDAGDIDAELADYIIQVALFGKVVFS